MRRLLPVILMCALVHAMAAADAAQIRALAERVGPAVVTVRVVTELKMAMMNQNQSHVHETDAVGVILDVDGTTAVDMFALDPASRFKALLSGNAGFTLESTLKSCVAELADGSTVAMEVALKDPAMGLAILRPREPGRSFTALTPDGAALQLGEHALLVSRAARHLASAILVSEVQVTGTVAGKQPYALIDQGPSACAAVCTADGRLAGVVCERSAPVPPANEGGDPDPFRSMFMGLDPKAYMGTPIVLSAEAVAKLVVLARKAVLPHAGAGGGPASP